jgi:hypothetical protein
MSPQTEFPLVFEKLRSILKPYEKSLAVKADSVNTYYLDGPYSEKWKKELFFGSAQIKKNYVSFYLMPVYMYPDLLKDISSDLKRHMQGNPASILRKLNLNFSRNSRALRRKVTSVSKKKNYRNDLEKT